MSFRKAFVSVRAYPFFLKKKSNSGFTNKWLITEKPRIMGRVKKKKGRFVGIPHHIVSHESFYTLSPQAIKLLIDLLHQYHGANNGNQSACWSLMKKRGWKSSSTLHRAYKELQEKGFVVITKHGKKMRGHPTLCAITWNGIDDAKKEYDEGIKVTDVPLNLWRRWTYRFFSSVLE